MNHDSDISNLMAVVGGFRSELADAWRFAADHRARADRLTAEHDIGQHFVNAVVADRDRWKAIADDLTDKMAGLLMQCADLRAERDALLTQCTVVRDATDPGPTLVAETRKAFPWRAIRGGDGRPTW